MVASLICVIEKKVVVSYIISDVSSLSTRNVKTTKCIYLALP
jgi:hypothetical protein